MPGWLQRSIANRQQAELFRRMELWIPAGFPSKSLSDTMTRLNVREV